MKLTSLGFWWFHCIHFLLYRHAFRIPKPSKHPSFPPLPPSPAVLTLTQNCSLPIPYCGFSFFTDSSYLLILPTLPVHKRANPDTHRSDKRVREKVFTVSCEGRCWHHYRWGCVILSAVLQVVVWSRVRRQTPEFESLLYHALTPILGALLNLSLCASVFPSVVQGWKCWLFMAWLWEISKLMCAKYLGEYLGCCTLSIIVIAKIAFSRHPENEAGLYVR